MPTRAPPMMKQTTAPIKNPMGHHLLSREGRGAPWVVCITKVECTGEKDHVGSCGKRGEMEGNLRKD